MESSLIFFKSRYPQPDESYEHIHKASTAGGGAVTDNLCAFSLPTGSLMCLRADRDGCILGL